MEGSAFIKVSREGVGGSVVCIVWCSVVWGGVG